MQIGFVGLGIMGRPMANNLMKGGHRLLVYGKRGGKNAAALPQESQG